MTEPHGGPNRPFTLEEATIDEFHAAIKSGQTTCVQTVRHYIDRVRAYNGVASKLVTHDGAPVPEVTGAVRAQAALRFPTDTIQASTILPDLDKYQGPPLEFGRMEATASDPSVQQQFGMITGIPNAGQVNALATLNLRGERSVTCRGDFDKHPSEGSLPICANLQSAHPLRFWITHGKPAWFGSTQLGEQTMPNASQEVGHEVNPDFEKLLHALPTDWEEKMYELGAFTYGGKIASPWELLRAIFLYCGLDQSLREVAGTLTLQAQRITDQAIWKRLNRSSPFLRAMLKPFLSLDQLTSIPHHLRLLAYDGTSLSCPGSEGADYRLNVGIDLRDLRFHEIYIGDVKMGESLKQYQLQPGDIAVVDQGYCSHSGILNTVHDKGADVIVRWNHSRRLYDTGNPNQPINFSQRFKHQKPGTISTYPVILKYAQSKKHPVTDKREVNGHLHVYRMTTDEAKKSQKRVNRKRQRKQKKTSERTLFLSQYVLIFTSVSTEDLSAEVILAIYRCRWQIELIMKRMKSLIHLDKMRAKEGSQLAETYVCGKILYLLLIDREMRTLFDQDWGMWEIHRDGTPWRFYSLLKKRLDSHIMAVNSWNLQAAAACFQVMLERPRKRKLQRVPQRVADFSLLLGNLPTAA